MSLERWCIDDIDAAIEGTPEAVRSVRRRLEVARLAVAYVEAISTPSRTATPQRDAHKGRAVSRCPSSLRESEVVT